MAPGAAEAARSSITPAKLALRPRSSVSAGKLLIVGAVAGSALTIGLGLALLGPRDWAAGTLASRDLQAPVHAAARGNATVSPMPAVVSDPTTTAGVTAEIDGPVAPAGPAAEQLPTLAGGHAPLRRAAGAPQAGSPAASRAGAGRAPSGQDVLMHEAALIGQARTAIVQGRPAAALDALDAAERDSSHSLEPEELSLRVRALRALGRADEASQVEETLRVRYPDSFLSR